jgi:type IV secretory pathway TrbD component
MSHHRNELTKVVIHSAATRPMMFMGAERGPIIVSLILSAYFIFLLTFRFTFFIGLPVGLSMLCFFLFLFRRMAKEDSHAWKVFLRHLKYRGHKGFYPARGRFGAFQSPIRDFK